MQLTIITKDSNQSFNKNEISISSQKGYDCFVNLNFKGLVGDFSDTSSASFP